MNYTLEKERIFPGTLADGLLDLKKEKNALKILFFNFIFYFLLFIWFKNIYYFLLLSSKSAFEQQ